MIKIIVAIIVIIIIISIWMYNKYKVEPKTDGTFYNKMIRGQLTGHCLTSEGNDVNLTLCKPGLANKWNYNSKNEIVDTSTGLCLTVGPELDAKACGGQDNMKLPKLIMTNCNGNDSQKFIRHFDISDKKSENYIDKIEAKNYGSVPWCVSLGADINLEPCRISFLEPSDPISNETPCNSVQRWTPID